MSGTVLGLPLASNQEGLCIFLNVKHKHNFHIHITPANCPSLLA